MRENRFRSRLRSGERSVIGWLQSADPIVAEVMAHAGFDAVTIDLQHGTAGMDRVAELLQAVSTTSVTPLVRVAWNSPDQVMRVLDMGAYGVICPMINSVEEARAFVAACRYPPAGNRSFGPVRGLLYGGSDYASAADGEILAIGMIETCGALEQIDAILAVPGLDSVFVGPADLSQALGGPAASDWSAGPVRDALDRVVQACAAAHKPAGIFTKDPDYAAAMLALGFHFVVVGSDLGYVAAGARQALLRARGGAGNAVESLLANRI